MAASIVWIEAEHFEERGGWVVDAQFMDVMGSPYLLAAGAGRPVADAVTSIRVPEPGKYRLWARTKDWAPEHHPGTFRILVNGKSKAGVLGGNGSPGWQWEDGGMHELGTEATLRLHDLSGYYGRCDALLFCAAPEFVPPASIAEIAELRRRHGGVSVGVRTLPGYDVVVVGGGLAGCTAAVAAARNGARAALIQDRPVLGGNASPEILVPPVGVWNGREEGPFDPHETGFIEEFRTPGRQCVTEGKLYAGRLRRFVEQEPNLDLFLNTHATEAEMADGPEPRIAAVLALRIHTGERLRLPARVVVDCSGDSAVAVSAGALVRHGKESRRQHHEPWAPEERSTHTMGMGLKYYPVDTGTPVSFARPNWACRFPDCASFAPGRHPRRVDRTAEPGGKGMGHQWILELGGTQDTVRQAEEIRDELLGLIFGIWDHLKNHCPENRGIAETWDLAWVGHVAGKRENRRLMGDYVLSQNNIVDKTVFPDTVAYGAWINDDHHSQGFFHEGSFGVHYDRKDYACPGVEYAIPFRSLYSRNIKNLMMAGRNISATHLALSNSRVMLTCALLGHAAGTGAAFCIRYDADPRNVCRDHIDRLQQHLLKEGAHIMGLRAWDPADLAPKAMARASSRRTWDGREVMAAANVANGYARARGERTNAWAPDPAADAPHWLELEWPDRIAFNLVQVNFQTQALAPEWFALEIWRSDRWERILEVPDNRHRRHVLGLEPVSTTRLRIVEEEPAGIVEIRVYKEPEQTVAAARRAHATMRLPDQGPFLPWEAEFRLSAG